MWDYTREKTQVDVLLILILLFFESVVDFYSDSVQLSNENDFQANIANFTQALIKYFPNTPIYESIGNHEGVPSDA